MWGLSITLTVECQIPTSSWPWLPLRCHFSPAQGWPTRLSVMMKMCCVCAMQYGVAQCGYRALEMWLMKLWNRGFPTLVLMNLTLNLNRHMWLLVAALGGTALTCWLSLNFFKYTTDIPSSQHFCLLFSLSGMLFLMAWSSSPSGFCSKAACLGSHPLVTVSKITSPLLLFMHCFLFAYSIYYYLIFYLWSVTSALRLFNFPM